jgi:hypothetical protein
MSMSKTGSEAALHCRMTLANRSTHRFHIDHASARLNTALADLEQ